MGRSALGDGWRRVWAGALGALLLTTAACGSPTSAPTDPEDEGAGAETAADGGGADVGAETATGTDEEAAEENASGEGAFDLDAFCAAAAPTQQAVDREFIGSDEHVAQLEALREVAPEELVEPVRVLRDHFDTDVHPSDPDSQDFKNFPTAIQETATQVQDEIAEYC